MKKIENTFVVTGFVGNNAEIRQFTNASVARFSLAVSRQEKNGEETNRVSAFMNMEAWRKNEHVDSFDKLQKEPCSPSRATSSQTSGLISKAPSTTASSSSQTSSILHQTRRKLQRQSLKSLPRKARNRISSFSPINKAASVAFVLLIQPCLLL